jgi:ketosteroid isomerase-like protein
MNRRLLLLCSLSSAIGGCAVAAKAADPMQLKEHVTETELAFAKTMADRDHAAFSSFVADEAVFLNGGKPLRGKQAVITHWKRFFTAPNAPFSWQPDLVEVLASGSLAQSIGPVFRPDGVLVARFYSTWRLERDGVWRIVFDDGYDVCNCPKT